MGSNGSKSFSVVSQTKKLQAKTYCPWPSVHNLGIWATVSVENEPKKGIKCLF